jgi:hypothetical protein
LDFSASQYTNPPATEKRKISETNSAPFVKATSSDNGLILLDADDLFRPLVVMAIPFPFFPTTVVGFGIGASNTTYE